jgi:hypothetical protein
METYNTGAIRSELYGQDPLGFDIRLDLVMMNGEALRRLAAAYGEGAVKYDKDPDTVNWMKGFPESVLLKHAIEHLICHLEGDKTEDHLAHATWNLFTAMWQEKYKPELMDLQRKLATLQKLEVDKQSSF